MYPFLYICVYFHNIQKRFIQMILLTKVMKIIIKYGHIPDHPYRTLIIEGSGSGKTNALLNLIEEQDNDNLIDKIFLYAKDL